MRIVHLCLAAVYVDGYSYQENMLPKINKEDGHEVRIIASTETFIDNRVLGYVEASEYVTEYNVPIKRLPYVNLGIDLLTKKIRKYWGLYQELEKFCPDVIMCHDLAFWSVLDVIRYKKVYSNVRVYADTHTAEYNSGQNWLSLYVLHRGIYRFLIKKAFPYIEKYFYIGVSEKEFNIKHYKVAEDKMEFYPLGGVLWTDKQYEINRNKRRYELNVEKDELVLLHSGKLGKLKRTKELIQAFSNCKELKAKLVIIGTISEDIEDELEELIKNDSRIIFLGWKSSEELSEYLCASDIYCQPGSVSATLQNAICCRNVILSYPHKSYTEALDVGNFLWASNINDIENVLKHVSNGIVDLEFMTQQSEKCAAELLDYRKLAKKIYSI